jgi:GAF domain-containing protein
MGAVEHLKTLCCLGLKPESAMIAVTPLLHEIIPHGWTRMGLYEPDATMRSAYAENPEMVLYNERFWGLLNDPSGIIGSLYLPDFRAVGIGWTLHRQGWGWLGSDWYREIEAPVDSCWWLDAMIGDAGQTIAAVHLTRPRSARPFTADDVQCLDALRPWLAHAFRRSKSGNARQEDEAPISTVGAPVRSGQLILTADAKLVRRQGSNIRSEFS